jgi:phosphatidylglycerol:prolipoprotein diacylglycerol transferase
MNVGYTLIMILAITIGFAVARLTQRGIGIEPWQRVGIGIGAFVGAMVGAKLPFLFDSWEAFLSGATWFSNGKTILTGLVGGYLGVELAKWALDVKVKTGDSFVLPVALAIAIGRIGCFHAGCCYGQPTGLPWAVVFPTVDQAPRHPTQLYESVFHLTAAGVFLWLASRRLFAGQRIKLYLIAYAAYRFLSEWLRPEPQIFGVLTGYQVASLVIIALFSWLCIRDQRALDQDLAKATAG